MREPNKIRPTATRCCAVAGIVLLSCSGCTPQPDGVVVAVNQDVWGLAVDSQNLYWTTMDGSVVEMPLDGRGEQLTLVSGLSVRPTSVVVDGSYVYWANLGSLEPDSIDRGSIMKAPIHGGTPTSLATVLQAGSIAVDATRLYWVNYNTLFSASLDGEGAAPLLNDGVAAWITGITVDDGFVYWTRQGPERQPTEGGVPASLAANTRQGPGAIAVDATHVYWTVASPPCDTTGCGEDHSAAVMKVAKDGGTAVKLADYETPGYPVTQLAVDSAYVYWTTARELQRVSIDGGAVETLAANQGDPQALVLSATDIYWATGPAGGEPAAIRKVEK